MPETVYQHDGVTIYHADALAVLSELATASVDALVTDPPAGIAFMGQAWDAFGGKPSKDRRAEQTAARDGRPEYPGYGNSHQAATPKAGEREAFIAAMSAILAEAQRVLRPGAHGLVWALPRTSHWTALALENAGFEIRDCVYHLFGTGFPKSRDVSKAIDKAAGAQREVVGISQRHAGRAFDPSRGWNDNALSGQPHAITAAATPDAAQWDGYGTALKPAVECWWLVRKPLSEKTVEANVLKHGTGALNIDGCRIGIGVVERDTVDKRSGSHSGIDGGQVYGDGLGYRASGEQFKSHAAGRWPANLALSHTLLCRLVGEKQVKGSRIDKPSTTGQMTSGYSGALAGDRPPRGHGDADNRETVEVWECAPDCPVRLLDEQSGERKSGGSLHARSTASPDGWGWTKPGRNSERPPDAGGASRFFHVGQADAEPAEPDDVDVAEVWECSPDCPVRLLDEQSGERKSGGYPAAGHQRRHSGIYGKPNKTGPARIGASDGGASRFYYVAKASKKERRKSKHPTIKSVALMRWLVRLITPPGGSVLDCFAGSGATVEACLREQRAVIAIDREREYIDDILARVADYHVTPETALGGGQP